MLFHLCGGQPARAPELLGLRWKNTSQGGTRNIFIENGLVAFVTGYHKGYRSSGNIKIIHRYLPREVAELLVYYLWLVLPFHEKVQLAAHQKRCNSAFLWEVVRRLSTASGPDHGFGRRRLERRGEGSRVDVGTDEKDHAGGEHEMDRRQD